jgi:thiol-disulfide isomerase/thioredoxin
MPLKRAFTFVLSVIILGMVLAGCSSDSVTNGKDKIYLFYSPQCPHCENVMPYVKNVSKKMDVDFCQVEEMNDECKAIAKKIGLKGVPTAVYRKGGELKVYVGEIKVKNLMLKVLGEKGST